MLPASLIDVVPVGGDAIAPRYLHDRDQPWVRALLDTFDACVGAPRAEVEAQLARARLPGANRRARRAMARLMGRSFGYRVEACRPPKEVRRLVFALAAAERGASRGEAIAAGARRLGVSPREVERCLYADLPGERILSSPSGTLSPGGWIERYNLALVQSLLFRAELLRIRLRDQVRQVIRFARLQRLLLRVEIEEGPSAATLLEVSGPLSLFRFTTKYGNAMARWLPALTRVPEWSLSSRCVLDGRSVRFEADHRDPLGTTHKLASRFDSKVESRFFRDFSRLRTGWQILREGTPLKIGSRILCPDFTLVHEARGLLIPVEIAGFWTPEYLEDKLSVLASAATGRLPWMVCIDRRLAAAADERLPKRGVHVFERRIDPVAFLESLEGRSVAAR